MRRLVLIALLLALATPGAAAATNRSHHPGVLHGTVTRGPGCAGQPQPCGEPMAGVKVVFLRHGRPVSQTTTTASGQYRIRLQAGLYGIRLPGENQWKPTQVRVPRGTTIRVDIAIDSLTG